MKQVRASKEPGISGSQGELQVRPARRGDVPVPYTSRRAAAAVYQERIPPYDIEAEMSVLGAMLLGDRSAVEKAAELLKAEYFYREFHGIIFNAMLDAWADLKEEETLDIIILRERLSREGTLDAVGGIGYLMQLAEYVPTTSNLDYYADIILKKAVYRRVVLGAAQMQDLAYAEAASPEEVAQQAEEILREATAPLLVRSADTWRKLSVCLSEEMSEIETREQRSRENPGGVTGVDTGLVGLNILTGGLQRSDMIIVAGGPGMGKTGLAMCVARNAAGAAMETGEGAVAVFSLEMNDKQLSRRLLASEAAVDSQKIATGLLSIEEWERLQPAAGRLWDLPLFIDDRTFLSCEQMRPALRRLRDAQGLSLVVVDYLQIMSPGTRRQWDNRASEVTEISRGVKNLAREFDVPIIAVCQLNRSNTRREDKRPQLFDLSESSSLEKEADIVAFVYRASYYESKPEAGRRYNAEQTQARSLVSGYGIPGDHSHEEAEIIIAKQRNGPTGTVKVRYTQALTLFTDLPEDPESPW